jgi:hypothetical protein
MDWYSALIIESGVMMAAFVLIWRLGSVFSLRKDMRLLFFFPILLFVSGFSLRLTEMKMAIDLGYFFTDFSFLFVYILFSFAFLTGQIRYWKKNKRLIHFFPEKKVSGRRNEAGGRVASFFWSLFFLKEK